MTELSMGEESSQAGAEGSRSQRGQQHDKPAEVYRASAGPGGGGGGGGLEEEAGEGVMAGHGGWIQCRTEDELLLAGPLAEHLSPPRTDKDSDEVDSSVYRRASQGRSPVSSKSAGGDSSILVGDRGGAASIIKVSYSEERRSSPGEGFVESGDSRSPGGGAFTRFRTEASRRTRSTPPQHTAVTFIHKTQTNEENIISSYS